MTKFKVNTPFLAHCNTCNKEVSALPLLNRGDLLVALQGEADVRVMHVVTEKDHIGSRLYAGVRLVPVTGTSHDHFRTI